MKQQWHNYKRRSRYRLSWQVLLLAIYILTANADPVPGKQPDLPAAKPAEREAPAEKSQPAPAPTFTPSEQIGADSAVSFPVDI
jgi:hypothetical protein